MAVTVNRLWNCLPDSERAARSAVGFMSRSAGRLGAALLVGWGLLVGGVQSARADDSLAGAEQFFESQVRPLLIERCVDCHGPDDQAGLLRLDRPPALDRQVNSGPLVKPGDFAGSLLATVVNYEDESLQMPPDEKLSDEEIAILQRWVDQGAYWPEVSAEERAGDPLPPSEQFDRWLAEHWAYQPVVLPPLPPVQASERVRQPLDRFLLAALEEAGIEPNSPADRRTLIRRAHFTLTGLPPSYEEIEAFAADDSPEAFERLVDRLLDSEHYGERWARHWLDVARFAETRGYQAGSVDTTYPYAYTYRDYVIDAFNDDKPFDQFVMEQIAADHMDLSGDQQKNLAALGFLTVGRKFMNRRVDIIDDQIDVVTRGFLGQTVACARCHDHKYDPIPTADYYSLYGVFDSSHEPSDLPLIGDPAESPHYEQFLVARAEKQAEVDAWVEEKRLDIAKQLRARAADYLVYLAKKLPNSGVDDVPESGPRGALRRPAIQRWSEFVAGYADQPHPVWSLWHRLAAIPPAEFAQQAAELWSVDGGDVQETSASDAALLQRLRQGEPDSMVAAAQLIGEYLEAVDTAWSERLAADAEATRLDDDQQEAIRQMLFAADSPTMLDTEQALRHLDQAERNGYNQQLSKVKAVESTHPGAPARAMVVVDYDRPREPHILVRGQPGNRGDRVPRRFLQVLEPLLGGQAFTKGSGRLELAQAIASPDNPLTPRVIVNRIWQQHFGFGLVRTASDFGSRGERPTHSDLLDYLAAEFIEDGWSIKRLHKRIMLSAAWQQSSDVREGAAQADPENRLLWRFPRRRLEFEPLRDRILYTADNLDLTVGGRSVMIHQDGRRRGLYAYIDREDVPGLLAVFDVPSPDASQAIRSRTTVPQQSLFLLNSDFVLQQAEDLAALTADQEGEDRIRQLYRRTLGRDPDAAELQLAAAFVAGQPIVPPRGESAAADSDSQPAPDWRFGFGTLSADDNEVQFTPLGYFSGSRWQPVAEYPHSEFGHLSLSGDGGHPGNHQQHSTIIRWTAPREGRVTLTGTLAHPAEQGDGVQAILVSSRLGRLQDWQVHHGEVATQREAIEVHAGDHLDLIVSCQSGPAHDSYRWAPRLTADDGTVWDLNDQFLAQSRLQLPPSNVDHWVKLAQVLIASNEFAFVD